MSRSLGLKLKRQSEGKYKVGQWVKSHFRAPWSGVILKLTERDESADLAEIEIRIDRRGNQLRKPKLTTLDVSWLEPLDNKTT